MTYENWSIVFDELVKETEEGAFEYIEGDCPLQETKEHITNETRFAIIQNFRCECGNRIEWGVCIRGTPILRIHKR